MSNDLIIIGSGPAGMSAAVYAKRQNIDCMILEKSAPGGQVINTFEIENYVGAGKTTGPDLATKMYNDVLSFNIPHVYGDVQEIKKVDSGFEVITDMETYTTKSVIIATGTTPRKFGVKNEDRFSFNGISWCAICDGALYKDKHVAVLGAGNSAVEESIYLASIASKVTLIARSHIKADKMAEEKLRSLTNVEILENTDLIEFIGESKLTGVLIKSQNETDEKVIDVDGVFEFIGFNPNTEFLNGFVELEKNYIKSNEEMETSVEGVFVAGDVRTKNLRQIITAASDGAIAAINAKKYINTL